MAPDDFHFIRPRPRSGTFDECNQDHWEYFFELLNQRSHFFEHTAECGALLAQVGRGIRWRIARCTQPPEHFQTPTIGVEDPLQLPLKMESIALYTPPKNIVGVSPISLQYHSQLSFEEMFLFRNAGSSAGEIVFEGKVPDMYFLGGVEEADHALYFPEHPEEADQVRTFAECKNLASYNAQPHEMRGLEARLAASIELGMPVITMQFLRKQIEDALRAQR